MRTVHFTFCWASSLLFMTASSATAQVPPEHAPRLDRLEHLTSQDGLSHNWVLDILQDRQGFLWLATDDGLNRYDGYGFKVYRHDPEDPGSLIYDYVESILEDRQGALWVDTRSGLSRLDRFTDRFTHFRHDPDRAHTLSHDVLTHVLEDRTGTVWVATRGGVNRFDRSSGGFERFHHDPEDPGSLSVDFIRRIYESAAGDLWLGGTSATLNQLERGSNRFRRHRIPAPIGDRIQEVWSFAEDDAGRLWIATDGAGLVRFDPCTQEALQVLPRHLDTGVAYVLRPMAEDTWWVGTDNGLVTWHAESETYSHFQHDPTEPGSLSHDRVMDLFEDRTGVLR